MGKQPPQSKNKDHATNAVAVLLCGCETWRMTRGDEHKLNVFQHKCLRKILKVYWPMKISNEEIRERSGTRTN